MTQWDFTTKAGIQKFVVTLVGLVVECLTVFGVAQGTLDTIQSIAAMATPILVVIIYYIVNQMAAKGKAQTEITKIEQKSDLIKTLAQTSPEVAIAAIQEPVKLEPVKQESVPQIKDKIAAARKTFGTWEGAKAVMLGTFKDRYEAALKRYASMSLQPIEAVRRAVEEVSGVQLTTKECELIANTPGFVGAVTANYDIKIISDLLDAIDRTPELAYLKTAFTKQAVRYAVKAIIDEAVLRIQAGEGNAASRLALQEFGYTPEEARNAQFSGGAVHGFNPWARAGVDPFTLEDL